MPGFPANKKIPFLPYPEIKKYGFTAATSLRGNDANLALHTGDNPGTVLKQRHAFFSQFGIDSGEILCLDQVHGAHIIEAKPRHKGKGAVSHSTAIRGDAVISNIPGLPVVIFTADCVPVLVFDPVKKVCALVHGGWRGIKKSILGKTLTKMKKAYKCQASDIILMNGPFIADCCYTVGPEFLQRFPGRFFHKRKAGLFFDLLGPLKEQALEAGLPLKNIMFKNVCTACDPEKYYSYRNDRTKQGRMATFMMLH